MWRRLNRNQYQWNSSINSLLYIDHINGWLPLFYSEHMSKNEKKQQKKAHKRKGETSMMILNTSVGLLPDGCKRSRHDRREIVLLLFLRARKAFFSSLLCLFVSTALGFSQNK